jgi:hypothetical protein
MRIYVFLKRAMSAEMPGTFEVISRLLNDEKEFSDYKYSAISVDVPKGLFGSSEYG